MFLVKFFSSCYDICRAIYQDSAKSMCYIDCSGEQFSWYNEILSPVNLSYVGPRGTLKPEPNSRGNITDSVWKQLPSIARDYVCSKTGTDMTGRVQTKK